LVWSLRVMIARFSVARRRVYRRRRVHQCQGDQRQGDQRQGDQRQGDQHHRDQCKDSKPELEPECKDRCTRSPAPLPRVRIDLFRSSSTCPHRNHHPPG
jgi:hypothetical protein